MATTGTPALPRELSAAIVNPIAYGQWHDLKEQFRWARDNMPVALVEAEGYAPFWAVTRHEDILAVSKDNTRFLNAPRSVVLAPVAVQMLTHMITGGSPHLVRSLVTLDAPEHMDYRKLTQSWFMPKNLAGIEARIREIARASVDAMVATAGHATSLRRSRRCIRCMWSCRYWACRDDDEPLMLKLTQEMFGGEDPDLNRARSADLTPEQISQLVIDAVRDFEGYFSKLAAERRADPRDDVASIVANAVIDGAADQRSQCCWLLHHPCCRRARHDIRIDRRRDVGAGQRSRTVRAHQGGQVAAAGSDRRGDPLDHAGAAFHAYGGGGLRDRRAEDRQG